MGIILPESTGGQWLCNIGRLETSERFLETNGVGIRCCDPKTSWKHGERCEMNSDRHRSCRNGEAQSIGEDKQDPFHQHTRRTRAIPLGPRASGHGDDTYEAEEGSIAEDGIPEWDGAVGN
jgi:hypothetical protein